MALKPTIYKFRIALSDVNRNYYDTLSLTVARHPSETTERMMVRVLAYCINASENLLFTKGISAADEPDIWAHSLNNTIDLWIDVGEPAFDRLKKASHISRAVKVYCFNTRANVWWQQGQPQFSTIDLAVYRLGWEEVQRLASFVQRTMDMSVTITGDSAYVATADGECELNWQTLQEE